MITIILLFSTGLSSFLIFSNGSMLLCVMDYIGHGRLGAIATLEVIIEILSLYVFTIRSTK
jgi:hypothetical protein